MQAVGGVGLTDLRLQHFLLLPVRLLGEHLRPSAIFLFLVQIHRGVTSLRKGDFGSLLAIEVKAQANLASCRSLSRCRRYPASSGIGGKSSLFESASFIALTRG
jgi:hypothetical protein